MNMGAPSLLEVEDLHTHYGEAHILQGVSLAVAEREVVTLIGRNGAGKTTTLRSIMGVARPTRGRIRFAGEDIAGLGPHEVARRGIAWVPEERRVIPNLTVYDNLRLAMIGSGVKDDGRMLEEVFGFFPRLKERIDYRGRFLSGGEQQMLAIARGLVAKPKLMLVDEPTEGLAPILVQTLTSVLGEISRRGSTILLVEQNLEVALALSSRLYVIDQGRIQFSGTPGRAPPRAGDPAAVPRRVAPEGGIAASAASASTAPLPASPSNRIAPAKPALGTFIDRVLGSGFRLELPQTFDVRAVLQAAGRFLVLEQRIPADEPHRPAVDLGGGARAPRLVEGDARDVRHDVDASGREADLIDAAGLSEVDGTDARGREGRAEPSKRVDHALGVRG